MNGANQQSPRENQGKLIPSGSAQSDAEQSLHAVVRDALKMSVLCLWLPNHDVSVSRAWRLLDDVALTRAWVGDSGLDGETLVVEQALVCDLEQLGLQYAVAEPSRKFGVAGVLTLGNPEALLRVAPYLVRFEPMLHVFQGRLDTPSYRRRRDGMVVEWS